MCVRVCIAGVAEQGTVSFRYNAVHFGNTLGNSLVCLLIWMVPRYACLRSSVFNITVSRGGKSFKKRVLVKGLQLLALEGPCDEEPH